MDIPCHPAGVAESQGGGAVSILPRTASVLSEQDTDSPLKTPPSPTTGSNIEAEAQETRRGALARIREQYERPVDCWSLDGELLLRSFSSIRIATETLLMPHPSLIAHCLQREPPVAYGFQWKLTADKPRDQRGPPLPIEVTGYSIIDTLQGNISKELMAMRQPSLEEEAFKSDRQRVECCYIDGKERMSFPNIAEAAKFFKVSKAEILDCYYGERKSLKRRKWFLVEEKANTPMEVENRISIDDYYNQRANQPVGCWSIDSKKLFHKFASAHEAAAQLMIDNVHLIVDCCRGKRLSVVGYRFKFWSDKYSYDFADILSINDLLRLRKPPIVDPVVIGYLTSLSKSRNAIDCYSVDGKQFLHRFQCLNDVKKELHIDKLAEIEECLEGTRSSAYGLR